MSRLLAGVGPLLPFTVRLGGQAGLPWVLIVATLSVFSVVAHGAFYDDEASQTRLTTTVEASPALALIFGPARDLLTADGFNAWRTGTLGAFFAGLMTILLVVRGSRADEDSGQAELLASGVMSREARLIAPLLTAAFYALLCGGLTFAFTVAAGGGVLNTLMLSATFTASGFVFAGVAAITVQLASDARAASTMAVGALGALYLVRGYLDSSQVPEWTAWLTPFGWLEQTRPATENNLWPLLLAAGLAFCLVADGFVLQARRDFGQGLIPPRRGPARAGSLKSAWALAFRLNASTIIAWVVAFAVIGLMLGSLADSALHSVIENPAVAQLIAVGEASGTSLVFEFIATLLRLLGMIAAIGGIQIVLGLYAEETGYRTEPVLAGALPRWRYLAASALLAGAVSALALTVGGVAIALVAAPVLDGVSFSDIVLQTAAMLPATVLLVALTLAAIGAIPALRSVGWAAVVLSFILTILGPLFELDEWILSLSPFWHVPNVTGAEPDWTSLLWISGIAITLTVAAFIGYRRRDIA